MLTAGQKTNLLGLDRKAIEAFFQTLGSKAFQGRNVLKWIHKHGVTDFDAMTDLSKKLRQQLKEVAEVRVPEIVFDQPASDGTHKWVLELDCNSRIEAVLIPEGDRSTLCVSSQVGCVLDCSFCSTGKQGFSRNLTAAEIIGQVWVATREQGKPLTNVVLMGMGEPLANYDAVIAAMDIMQDDLACMLSKYRVTISTSGIVPAIEKLREISDVSLAVSLHAPNNELRDQLVPINQKYPLEVLIPACREYVRGDKRRKITWEYVMLDGINDTDKHAKQLIRLLEGTPSKINLIPFNTFPGTKYRCSTPGRIDAFRQRLMRSGIITMTRKTRGDDIDAACGQLVGLVRDRSRRGLKL
ncbi:23S rRNA (adenine(2503)-C(2))-methyltransferase RlmN [Candidatus Vondammii sp. HM_W22]|uniref:23S rRNA (adenine(2503)-C(2))-methyltransferase RlmN n=1 Tax=Candidatus Vondammii sp. HM_W22 TaxID=2687299 RepID=UPI00403DC54B